MNCEILSFEEITEKRIEFGKYQMNVIFILGLIFTSSGIELCAITIIMPNIQLK